MADQTDVASALADLIGSVIYPGGTGQPPAQGTSAQVFAGWPLPSQLDQLMAANKAAVWVYARPEVKDVTRYPYVWQVEIIQDPTITATASGQTVTIGGAVATPFSPQNVFVFLDGQAFSHAVQANDTPTSIATALTNLISAAFPGATNAGPAITIPTGPPPSVRVGTVGTSSIEVARYEQQFQIVIAASTPDARAALGRDILAALSDTVFLTMPDGSAARIRVTAPVDMDNAQKVLTYRRDIRVLGEYAVTKTQTTATVEAVVTQVNTTIRSY